MSFFDTANYADFQKRTLPLLDKMHAHYIGEETQRYCGWKLLEKFSKTEPDGKSIRRNIITGKEANFQHTSPFEAEQLGNTQADQIVEVTWRYAMDGYYWDERIFKENGGASRIVDLSMEQEKRCAMSIVEGMETDFWSGPLNNTDDAEKKKPLGINHWMPASSAAATGFQGQLPNNFTTLGGLSLADFNSHYTFNYPTVAAVSEDTFFDALRTACLKMNYMAPVQFPGEKIALGRSMFFTGSAMYAKLQKLAKQQNDNLKSEFAGFGGNDSVHSSAVQMGSTLTIEGIPVVFASKLDSISYLDDAGAAVTAPFLGINFDALYPVKMAGEWDHRVGPLPVAHNARVREIKRYFQYNWIAVDRRPLLAAHALA